MWSPETGRYSEDVEVVVMSEVVEWIAKRRMNGPAWVRWEIRADLSDVRGTSKNAKSLEHLK